VVENCDLNAFVDVIAVVLTDIRTPVHSTKFVLKKYVELLADVKVVKLGCCSF
jgi:hypothetical protein